MPTPKNSKRTFQIQARLWVETTYQISAENIQDAVAASKNLKIGDLIELLGDHNDSGLRITGVFEDYKHPVI